MLLENPGGNQRYGMLARLRGLAAAFLVMMILTFSIVGFLSGMLLMLESFDDKRASALGAWNDDVRDWNDHSRAQFKSVGDTFTINDQSMTASTEDPIFEYLQEYDSNPAELLKPDALFYKRTMDISDLEPEPTSFLQVVLGTSDSTNTLDIPLVFTEVRCRYVQRGKFSRQVCEPHFFALQGICVKVDHNGSPSRMLDGVTGASTDVGCSMGTEGMFRPRLTNIWSPGIYKEYSEEYELKLPDSIDIAVHSNSDPALTATVYTLGFYDFGQSPGAMFRAGFVTFFISSIILFGFCCLCTLQYIWPTAPSYTDRCKYFYRRYLRTRHAAFNKWWANTFGTPEPQMPPVSAEELLLEEQHMQPGDTWQGPRDGGHRLGGPMPPLVQSV